MDAPLYLGHITAMQYHRLFTPRNRPAAPGERLATLRVPQEAHLNLSHYDLGFLDKILGPIHLYVGSEADRLRYQRAVTRHGFFDENGEMRPFVVHVMADALPSNMFSKVADGIYVATPALAYAQLASDLSIPKLAHYGCELTSRYTPDPAAPFGLAERVPLLKPEDLTAMRLDLSERWPKFPGSKAMRQAEQYILPHARSPREIESMLVLSLPARFGGYALPVPSFGYEVIPSAKQRALVSQGRFECDLFYPRNGGGSVARGGGVRGVDVEYPGKKPHEGRKALDDLRRDELKLLGIEMLVLSPMILEDRLLMDKFASRLAAAMGYRRRPTRLDDFRERQRALRREFFRK